MAGFIGNLIPMTLGNIAGGGVFVALVYWLIYLYGQSQGAATSPVSAPGDDS